MPRNRLLFTLRAWPVVTAATLALCYLTKAVAGWIGVDLPDQQNVELLHGYMTHAFDSLAMFCGAAILVVQVVAAMPVVEELAFRWLLDGLPRRLFARWRGERGERLFGCLTVLVSSVLFSAAHYVRQPWPDAAFLALFFFGVAQCWLYRRTGRLWCAMLNHALFNLANLVLLLVLPEAA